MKNSETEEEESDEDESDLGDESQGIFQKLLDNEFSGENWGGSQNEILGVFY
jgi:hypothetical protein